MLETREPPLKHIENEGNMRISKAQRHSGIQGVYLLVSESLEPIDWAAALARSLWKMHSLECMT